MLFLFSSPNKRKSYWELGDLSPKFFKDFTYLFFRERGREGEREGEKHQHVMYERSIIQLLLACPQLGIWPGNRTCDLSFHRPALNPLSNTSQGSNFHIYHQWVHAFICLFITYLLSTLYVLGTVLDSGSRTKTKALCSHGVYVWEWDR